MSKLFLENTGYTLHNYIIKYKLSRAVKLLMSTDLPIAVICEKVNISDLLLDNDDFSEKYLVDKNEVIQLKDVSKSI